MRSRLVGSRQAAVGRTTVKQQTQNSIAHGFKHRNQLAVGRFKTGMLLKLVFIMSWMITVPSLLIAQNDTTQTHTVDMATTMRSNGKIYVVVAVLTIILLGLFFYLIRLDRKIGKLEKE